VRVRRDDWIYANDYAKYALDAAERKQTRTNEERQRAALAARTLAALRYIATVSPDAASVLLLRNHAWDTCATAEALDRSGTIPTPCACGLWLDGWELSQATCRETI